jgi:putative membrane protein
MTDHDLQRTPFAPDHRETLSPIREIDPFNPKEFERPAPQLLTYYILTSLLSGPGVVIVLPMLWFRYATLRYRFEDSGLRMKVGVLFRKEVITAYRRIQDIHVTSNIVQRWMGIACVSIQTASGSAMPEIILEGVTNPEGMRDWLYERLRGAKGDYPASLNASANNQKLDAGPDEVQVLLSEIRDHLATLARRSSKNHSVTEESPQ